MSIIRVMPQVTSFSTRSWAISAIVLSAIAVLFNVAGVLVTAFAHSHEGTSVEAFPATLSMLSIVVGGIFIFGGINILRGLESGRDMLELAAAAGIILTLLRVVYGGILSRGPEGLHLTLDQLGPQTHLELPHLLGLTHTTPLIHSLGLAGVLAFVLIQIGYYVSLYRHMAVS